MGGKNFQVFVKRIKSVRACRKIHIYALFFMFFSRKKSKSRKKGEKRIFNAAEEYGLPKPRFQEFDNMFRVEVFRNSSMTELEKKFGENSRTIGVGKSKHRKEY